MIDKQRELLVKPFHENEVEWRIQSSGITKDGKPWAMALCYTTNRGVMNRFDEVFGIGGWANEFKPTPTMQGTLCGISCRFGDEWVTKWDGAEDTKVEATKGGLSSSMKRAAVQWGVGRYLYSLDVGWVVVVDNKTATSKSAKVKGLDGKDVWFNWEAPQLPNFALPIMNSQIKVIHDEAINTGTLIEDIESAFNISDLHNLTKEDGLSIIQSLSKKEKLSDEDREKFIEELKKDK